MTYQPKSELLNRRKKMTKNLKTIESESKDKNKRNTKSQQKGLKRRTR